MYIYMYTVYIYIYAGEYARHDLDSCWMPNAPGGWDWLLQLLESWEDLPIQQECVGVVTLQLFFGRKV